MDFEDIRCFDDLNDLYWKNRELLGEEEQRLFRGILLELQKGEYCDRLPRAHSFCRTEGCEGDVEGRETGARRPRSKKCARRF